MPLIRELICNVHIFSAGSRFTTNFRVSHFSFNALANVLTILFNFQLFSVVNTYFIFLKCETYLLTGFFTTAASSSPFFIALRSQSVCLCFDFSLQRLVSLFFWAGIAISFYVLVLLLPWLIRFHLHAACDFRSLF